MAAGGTGAGGETRLSSWRATSVATNGTTIRTATRRARREGFIEGRNLATDSRGFDSRSEQYEARTALLVNSGVDVLVCGGDLTIRAAQRVTRTVPIVGIADDMLGSALVASLARPGSNTTGVSILTTELDGKRQELLLELLPGARRMAVLVDPDSKSAMQLQETVDAARVRGVELLPIE